MILFCTSREDTAFLEIAIKLWPNKQLAEGDCWSCRSEAFRFVSLLMSLIPRMTTSTEESGVVMSLLSNLKSFWEDYFYLIRKSWPSKIIRENQESVCHFLKFLKIPRLSYILVTWLIQERLWKFWVHRWIRLVLTMDQNQNKILGKPKCCQPPMDCDIEQPKCNTV